MQSTEDSLRDLVERLDRATDVAGRGECTARVKAALSQAVQEGHLKLEAGVTSPCLDSYGRRHLHTDPNGRYSVVAMTWGAGQGTPIHDHDDKWCVECVYQGEIVVTNYELFACADPTQLRLESCDRVHATLGEAGALIPPHDYHVIENRAQQTAVTIHVYGGEMTGCNVYLPTGEGDFYQKHWKSLGYDE